MNELKRGIDVLDTGIKNVRNVHGYSFGAGCIGELGEIISARRKYDHDYVIFFIDRYFENDNKWINSLPITKQDNTIFVNTEVEPNTECIDELISDLRGKNNTLPCAIVGIGGGTTLDTAKAISNLLTNEAVIGRFRCPLDPS